MRKVILAVILSVFSSVFAAAQALNNDAIVKMIKAGLSEGVIVATVNASPGSYDTTGDALIALKTAGASDRVITAIILKSSGAASLSAPNASSASGAQPDPAGAPVLSGLPPAVDSVGIYYLDPSGSWEEVGAEVVNFKTSGALKHYASAGVIKEDANGTIGGIHSRLMLKMPATFIIVVPEGTSPGEYQLLRLHVLKDSREFRSFTGGITHETGGAAHDTAEFTSRKIAPHAYQVTLSGETGRGEFGFLPPQDAGTGKGMASSGKIYTFSLGR